MNEIALEKIKWELGEVDSDRRGTTVRFGTCVGLRRPLPDALCRRDENNFLSFCHPRKII